VSCETWQAEASKTNKLAFDDLWTKLNSTDKKDDSIDSLTAFMVTHTQNIQSPNFSGWMTILPTLKIFLDNYSINYFIALAVKQSTPANGLLSQYACTLLGFMNLATGTLSTERKQLPIIVCTGIIYTRIRRCFLYDAIRLAVKI